MPYTQIDQVTLRGQLEDRWERSPFWSADEGNRAINEALRWWNLLTGFWRKRIVFGVSSPSAPVSWISLPSALVFGARVAWNNFALEPSSLQDLNSGRPYWLGETTAMGGDIPSRVTAWAPAGLTLLALWPADASGCGELVVDGVAATPVLVNPTDKVDIGRDELGPLVGEALYLCALKEGGPRFEIVRNLHLEFLRAAADRNARLKASALYRRLMGADDSRFSKPMRAGGVEGAAASASASAPAAPDASTAES